jgi:Tol biopolymer transport system component
VDRVRGSRPTIAVALVALLLAVLATGGSPAPGAAFPGANGRIAYASSQGGNWDIYSMNADGSGQIRLTTDPGADTQPSFSPDGTKIAFASNRSGNWDIYSMNADGSGQIRLTTDPGAETQPSFSPDGTKIAFAGKRGASWYTDVYLMNADGSEQVRLTTQGGIEEGPTFSPDGQRIAFSRIQAGHKNIFVMNPSGGELTDLTNGGSDDREPSFSPDGQRIVFSSRRDGHFELYAMSASGGGVTKLTTKPVSHMPAFAPDGKLIAFVRGDSIYTMNTQGGGVVRLTKDRGSQVWPSWQPRLGPAPVHGGSSSGLRIGKPILDKLHGTAKLPVTVPGPGTIRLGGPRVKPLAAKTVSSATTVKLKVKPRSGVAKTLMHTGSAKVKAIVTYTPKGSGAETASKTFKLRKKTRH